jgi:RNA polymerase sigma-70 factor (ECF subfamily)
MQADQLKELWREYAARVRAFIRGRVRDEAEADDMLQEVFLRVHTGLCCKEAVTRLDSWIYRVTRNLLIDHRRRHRPSSELPEDVPAVEEERPEDDPRAMLAFSLRATIDELPAVYREALLATEYDGLSQRELANRAGISLSGAKSRVQRAREKLRELLLDCCHFELDRLGRVVDYHARCCACSSKRADPVSRPSRG